jgi:hypothetical protein
MDKRKRQAIKDVMRVFMFDMWLRFYFVQEEDGKLFVRVPEDEVEAIREKDSQLAELVDIFNGQEIDQESSTNTICSFVASRFDGAVYPAGTIAEVLNSSRFKIDNYVFNLWVKTHEPLLDEKRYSFEDWEESFAEWRQLDEVKEYLNKLTLSNVEGACASDAVH